MFADGDDWLEPDCVEYLVKIAEENNCEMSTTDAIFTTRDGVIEDGKKLLSSKEYFFAKNLESKPKMKEYNYKC